MKTDVEDRNRQLQTALYEQGSTQLSIVSDPESATGLSQEQQAHGRGAQTNPAGPK